MTSSSLLNSPTSTTHTPTPRPRSSSRRHPLYAYTHDKDKDKDTKRPRAQGRPSRVMHDSISKAHGRRDMMRPQGSGCGVLYLAGVLCSEEWGEEGRGLSGVSGGREGRRGDGEDTTVGVLLQQRQQHLHHIHQAAVVRLKAPRGRAKGARGEAGHDTSTPRNPQSIHQSASVLTPSSPPQCPHVCLYVLDVDVCVYLHGFVDLFGRHPR